MRRDPNTGTALRELFKEELANAEKHGRSEGERSGEKRGQALLGALICRLLDDGRVDDARRASQDEEYRERLYRELHFA